MNTVEDRANRIEIAKIRARDFFWIMSLVTVSNSTTIAIISFEAENAYLPITVWLVFTAVMGIMGSLNCLDDLKANVMDRGEAEENTHVQNRFENVQWDAFKGLIVAGIGLTVISQLYVMYSG